MDTSTSTQITLNDQNIPLSPAIAIDAIENLMEREKNLNTNNKNHYEQQHDEFNKIKQYKHHSFALLNNNKQLVFLEQQQTNNTIPKGLLPEITSGIRLSDGDKGKWQGILNSCGRQLRNLLIQHHRDRVREHIEKRNELKRKIPPQNLHTINKEITDQYENTKRRRTNTPRASNTPRTPNAPRTPHTSKNF